MSSLMLSIFRCMGGIKSHLNRVVNNDKQVFFVNLLIHHRHFFHIYNIQLDNRVFHICVSILNVFFFHCKP